MMVTAPGDIVAFIANHLKCPICFDLFTEPVTLPCGHSYCLRCIKDHLNTRTVCPECRARIRTDLKLHKNVTISAILELQEVGGRDMWDMWDRVWTGSERDFTQDCLQRRLDFLKLEIQKIETLQAEFHSALQNGRCFVRDNIRTSDVSVDMSRSSLDCEGAGQSAEDTSVPQSPPPVTPPVSDAVVQKSKSGPEENKVNVSKDPDVLRGFSEGKTSAAIGEQAASGIVSAPNAEFVPLSFSPGLGHRRLVFLPQRQRIEVRSCPSLRTELCRFEACQWMAEQEFSTGRHYWDTETSTCSGWAVGVAYKHLGREERLGRSKSSWCIEWSSSRFRAWHDGSETPLKQRQPGRLRILLDMDTGYLSFWSGADEEAELFSVQVEFRAPVRPVVWLFGTKPGNALSFPRP